MIGFLSRWLRRRQLDAELREELESHLALREAHNRSQGMPPDEARDSARKAFGARLAIHEQARASYVNLLLETLIQDVRYALRGFRRNPGFTLTALLALTLGIGASTAVFSVVDRILFRSLPYPDDEQLVSVGLTTPIDDHEFFFGPAYLALKESPEPFRVATSWTGATACDLTETNPVRLTCGQVEADFLTVLGLSPLLGRNFTIDEDSASGPRAALISYGLWQGRFAGATDVVGTGFNLDGVAWTVIGVLPPTFEVPTLTHIDILIPQRMDRAAIERNVSGRFMRVFARLNDGLSVSQARAALDPILELALRDVPPQYRDEIGLVVRPLRERQVGQAFRASWTLLGAVAAVVLIACLNVAGLLLARAAQRQFEFAVRAAVGAGKRRLIRQAITESLILGALGAFGGFALAGVLLELLTGVAPLGIPRLSDAALDLRVLGFSSVVSLTSALLFSVGSCLALPAASSLAGSRTLGAPQLGRRYLLVSVQIAASMILLTGAGLLVQDLRRLQRAPLGMEVESVATVQLVLGREFYSTVESRHSFFEAVEDSLANLPGVTAAAVSDSAPPAGFAAGSHPLAVIRAEGQPVIEEGTGGIVLNRWITPGYFQALGARLLEGRSFVERDRVGPESTIILNQSLAATLFGSETPLGRGLQLSRTGPRLEIVGIVQDIRNAPLGNESLPEYYLARNRSPQSALINRYAPARRRRAVAVVRSQLAPQALADVIRSEIAKLDPALPVSIETMEQRVDRLAARPRFNALLLSLFALVGGALAAIGLFGVTSALVNQRRREIGLRIAIGATRSAIARLVVSRALFWALAGVTVGMLGALAATRVLDSLLSEISPQDPFVLASAAAALVLIASLAAATPAIRAASINPTRALREE